MLLSKTLDRLNERQRSSQSSRKLLKQCLFNTRQRTPTMSTSESEMNETDKQCHFVQECESGVLIPRPADSCIKRWLWLWLFRKETSNKDRQGTDSPLRLRQLFFLVVAILLGLTVMVLLLLWNYQCIFIERLCRGHEESSVFPVFAGRVAVPTVGSLG
ncbi:hypothetical protein SKAU_G00004880 [Synaphobranchus kaupii]|uniref:Uncharacterized protein n=1 Tax=Synaphobranchus kaupii TaxID=118154 RepID=A0A9Q1JCD6_SYNKA|nr:hypothetical protein SKAU_G00004880 [Synaphobranchus kaupii]